MEIEVFVIAVFSNFFNSFSELFRHFFEGILQVLELGLYLQLATLTHSSKVRTITYVTDSSNNLKLRSSFVNGGNTGIAVNTFDREILHVTGSAKYLNCIVGNLVTAFA